MLSHMLNIYLDLERGWCSVWNLEETHLARRSIACLMQLQKLGDESQRKGMIAYSLIMMMSVNV